MKKILFLLVLACLAACYLTLDSNYGTQFRRVGDAYADSSAVNLDAHMDPEVLRRVLFDNGYVPTDEDARFVAAFIASRLQGGTIPESLAGLNGRRFQLPAAFIDERGTPSYRQLLQQSYWQSGWGDEAARADAQDSIPSHVRLCDTLPGTMSARISHRLPDSSLPRWKSFFGFNSIPAGGILVRLDGHVMGSDRVQHSRTLAYGRTDSEGKVCFSGLDPQGSYSVLPLHADMTFGPAKGTFSGSLAAQQQHGGTDFRFVSTPRSVKAFSTVSLRRMRQDGLVTVRTPVMFRSVLTRCLAVFAGVWALVFLLGNTCGRRMDNGLAALLMGMSGLGMMLQFAINDALTGRLLGLQAAQGAIAGAVAVAVVLCFDWLRFFRGGYPVRFNALASLLLLPFRLLRMVGLGRIGNRVLRFLFRKRSDEPLWPGWMSRWAKAAVDLPGSGYLWWALLLTAALFVFGQSVGGMKVNLYLGMPVQPSEIVKFLLTFFMAAFFFYRGDRLVGYSCLRWTGGKVSAGTLMWRKLKVMLGMLCGLGLLMAMYLKLGDLGPAMIVSLSFILMYSLVKSRVGSGNVIAEWDDIWSCDLTRLLLGVVTFIACLAAGWALDHSGLPHFWLGVRVEYRALMAAAWFAVAVTRGIRRKKLDESPLMFNLVIVAFVYGSSLLNAMDMTDAAQRLDTRTAVCTNTFGTLQSGDGADRAEPAANAQTAIGIWALAAGGWLGQGLGDEGAHHIPAYHTDYIFQSIGFMVGLAGLLLLLFMYLAIFRRSLVIGYRSGHQFLLFLCTALVMVSAIQLLVVFLGTLGLMPMTGLAAGFLSYGRVSVFFHLLSFGIILSVSARGRDGRTNRNRPFGHALALLSLVYFFFMTIIVGTLVRYMWLDRDETLTGQLYVTNPDGLNVIAANPFVESAVRAMHSGDIYDRNGVLLATSVAERMRVPAQTGAYARAGLTGVDSLSRRMLKRYYPFGGHLAFLLGDANDGLFFSSVDASPRGYLAEARFMSELRGYSNIMLDRGKPVKVDLHSPAYRPGRFVGCVDTVIRQVQLRDYSPLLPYIKAGPDSELVARFNRGDEPIHPQDVRLTVDAVLQTRLQQELAGWQCGTNRYASLERRAVVVLDATYGDLLASSCYPTLDRRRLLDEGGVYSDARRPVGWTSYTDVDSGFFYATAPGSTAKVMSALAAVAYADSMGWSVHGPQFMYGVHSREQIHANARVVGKVGFHDAVVHSSNAYFINMVNDHDLYAGLADIYGKVGVSPNLDFPYALDYHAPASQWLESVTAAAGDATQRYDAYRDMRTRGRYHKLNDWRISHPAWQWAWGQGVNATLLAMGRVAATLVDGSMPVTRFRMDSRPSKVRIVDSDGNLRHLRSAMRDESLKLGAGTRMARAGVYGKSGTAERSYSGPLAASGDRVVKVNDAWYICTVPDCRITRNVDGRMTESTGPIAVAVRVERTAYMSGVARLLVEEVVLKTLHELGYIPALD